MALRLRPSLLDRAFQELDINFKSYWRALISIATNLHRTKELRDLFIDLAEKLIEPWKQNHWQAEQVKLFLPAITQSVLDLEVSRWAIMNYNNTDYYRFVGQFDQCH